MSSQESGPMDAESAQMEDTLPKILLGNYRRFGDQKICMRKKELGIWREYTWKDYYIKTKYLSLGLRSFGLERGDKVSIMGDNAPEWYWAEIAIQAAGSVSVGIFPDASSSEAHYIIHHSNSKFIIVEDEEQVDKILKMKNDLPHLQRIIYWGTHPFKMPSGDLLISFDDTLVKGREYEETYGEIFEKEIQMGDPKSLAILSYTPGTMGQLKAVPLSHNYLVNSYVDFLRVDPLFENDKYFSFISPAWIMEQLFGIVGGLYTSFTVNFPEGPETFQQDLREIGPRFVIFPSTLWYRLFSTIKTKMAEIGVLRKCVYNFSLTVGSKTMKCTFGKKKPSYFLKVLYFIADRVFFKHLRDRLGLSRVKKAYTTSGVLHPYVFSFFNSMGIKLKQIYALTEAGIITAHRSEDIRDKTVGTPLPGVNVNLSSEGEIIVRGPHMFQGYYNHPDATSNLSKDRWFCTGDMGVIEKDGHIVFIDRKSGILDNLNGTKYSLQLMEGNLRLSTFVSDAVVLFTGLKNLTALITINFENTAKWAAEKGVPFTTREDLSKSQAVGDLLGQEVAKINGELPIVAQIKGFTLFPRDFSADKGELTRTGNPRRIAASWGQRDSLHAVED